MITIQCENAVTELYIKYLRSIEKRRLVREAFTQKLHFISEKVWISTVNF